MLISVIPLSRLSELLEFWTPGNLPPVIAVFMSVFDNVLLSTIFPPDLRVFKYLLVVLVVLEVWLC